MRTETIVLDGETQEPIDELADRNDKIKERLAPVLQKFLERERELMAMKKPPKLGYQFAKQIFLVLSSYGQMTVDEYASLDYETINNYWLKYLELTAYYNEFFEIVDNKQMFCAFARLNTRQYAQLERSEDEDIANLMNTINSAFVGLGFLAGESGNADSKAIKNRLGASNEDGHSVISAIEEKVFGESGTQSEAQIAKELEAIGIKYLPNGKE